MHRHAIRWLALGALALSIFPVYGATFAQDAASVLSRADSALSIEFVWETSGGPTPLNYPMDITVDPEGNVWVVDMANAQFQIFSPDGEFLETWGTAGNGPGEFDFFDGPVAEETPYGGDVAFDADGNIYVADLANSRVQKFTPDRAFVTEWGGWGAVDGPLGYPWSLDVDDAGNVYVADYGLTNVQIFASDGTYLRTLASAGSGDDGLTDVASVVVADDGFIWVGDYAPKLLKFSPLGEFVAAFGAAGGGDGTFSAPNVGAASGGLVFVADVGNHRIQVFDSAGNAVAAWGSEGNGPGEFRYPVGVALDGEGGVYVADIGNNRIQKFRLVPRDGEPGKAPIETIFPSIGGPSPGAPIEGRPVTGYGFSNRLGSRSG